MVARKPVFIRVFGVGIIVAVFVPDLTKLEVI